MMHRDFAFCLAAGVLAAFGAVSSVHAGPYAVEVVAYDPGTNPAPGYTDPSAALGPPERTTGEGTPWPGDVTMFNPAWGTDEIVSIGEGGRLVLRFDHPVRDDPANPFGLDLIVFGNAAFWDGDYPNGVAVGLFGNGAGRLRVSQDGLAWFDLPGAEVDTLWPTQGYADTSGPYGADGTVPADPTRPVDPSIEWMGLGYADLLAAYDGSAGGTGIDIAPAGLPWIRFVEVSVPVGAGGPVEIDAVADVVPEPAAVLLVLVGGGAALLRRRLRR